MDFHRYLPAILNNLSKSIKIIDTSRNIVFANTVAIEGAEAAGPGPIEGKKCYRVFWGKEGPCAWCGTEKALSTGETQVTRVRHDGGNAFRFLEISSYPLMDDDGHVELVMEVVKDILGYQPELRDMSPLKDIISRSDAMLPVFDAILRVGQTDAPVLIRGETGTGKERVAHAIHQIGRRKSRPFIIVDCGAIVETLFESELFGHERGAFTGANAQLIGRIEQADGGTLFLDEIGNISTTVQAKLLRALQEGEFERVGGRKILKANVRVIAATNVNIENAIIEKKFREDLFFRLNVVPIVIPPLRERLEDIPLLAKHFLDLFSVRHRKGVKGITQGALRLLMGYRWPGNIRELENVIERAVIMAKKSTLWTSDLPDSITHTVPSSLMVDRPLSENLREAEIKYLREVLTKYMGHSGMAARRAGIGERTLRRKMREYSLELKDFRK